LHCLFRVVGGCAAGVAGGFPGRLAG
jgi:hypothetical protein